MKQFTIDNSQLIIKILVFFFIFSIVHFQFSIPVHAAQQDLVGYSKIHPASPLYFLKTIRENLELKLAFTPRVKILRQLEFATRRLREVRTLISINQDLIPPTLERYISHLNTLPDSEQKYQDVATKVKESLVIHLEVLQKTYLQVSSLRAKMAIRSAMNKIIQRADLSVFAKLPVCTFFAKEASSSALNQTEQFVLKNRFESCFKQLMPDKPSQNP